MRTCRIAEQDSALGRLPHHGALPQEALPLTPKGTPVHGSGTASYDIALHANVVQLNAQQAVELRKNVRSGKHREFQRFKFLTAHKIYIKRSCTIWRGAALVFRASDTTLIYFVLQVGSAMGYSSDYPQLLALGSLRQRFLLKKPLRVIWAEENQSDSAEGRVLSLFDLVCIGVGGTLGSGVFVLTGVIAAKEAGAAVVLCWFLSAVACTISALSYMEMSVRIPSGGTANNPKTSETPSHLTKRSKSLLHDSTRHGNMMTFDLPSLNLVSSWPGDGSQARATLTRTQPWANCQL
eukprot:1180879-Prorocentrum_minimum.AAC.2